MMRNRLALLTALGVDNFGSGLFLPLALLYATRAQITATLGPAASTRRPAPNALAEAVAPRAVRGRYLAAFQYAFTVPGVVAPAVVALFSVAIWLPWLVAGTGAGLAAVALPWLALRLPGDAVRPEPAGPPQVAVR
jgi:hypothetical protein